MVERVDEKLVVSVKLCWGLEDLDGLNMCLG